jgi:proteasome lid subunit RPN8/RPN11
MLRLLKADLERIYTQSTQEYPAECCGLLTADSAQGVSTVHPCENIQDRLHSENPTEYPRDSRIAYFIDPQALYEIITATERSGGVITGFYHSHIDCEAYFSDEDKERAMAWDEPAYPDAVYLVISAYADRVRGYEAFVWDAARQDFQAVEIEVAEG